MQHCRYRFPTSGGSVSLSHRAVRMILEGIDLNSLIFTELVENAIRPLAVGRKNWLHVLKPKLQQS